VSGRDRAEVIVAVDVADATAADALVARLGDEAVWLKVGLELFCAEGPQIVRRLAGAGHRIMLDLKLHDIPQTVARAVAAAGRLGASLLTVHAAGGRAMLEAAATAAAEVPRAPDAPPLGILAVTVLTSMDDDDLVDTGCTGDAQALVSKRARLAAGAGCAGVVASPHEAASLRREAPKGFLIVTPGVRPAGAAAGDQKRVMTPADAARAGADFVVVGRPITGADDPRAALSAIRAELGGRA
jgi:orotidine-5'-phosphate decarboxylase